MGGRVAGVALIAALLAGCCHVPDPMPCPAPAGELLVAPQRLPAAPAGPMSRAGAVKLWLQHIEAYELQRDRYGRLQQWGQAQCQWPAPVAATKPSAG